MRPGFDHVDPAYVERHYPPNHPMPGNYIAMSQMAFYICALFCLGIPVNFGIITGVLNKNGTFFSNFFGTLLFFGGFILVVFIIQLILKFLGSAARGVLNEAGVDTSKFMK